MKRIILLAAGILFLTPSCKKYLDVNPQGTLTEADVTSAESVDGLVTAAYAAIGNDFWTNSITSMWAYGSVRSDDAYKGGGSVDDVGEVNTYEQYNLLQASTGGLIWNTWENAYKAISRANFALRTLENIDAAEFSKKDIRMGELRFLRGHLFFVLKVLFKKVPYIDETLTDEEIITVSNDVLTNDQLWEKIAEDFQFAVDKLG